MTFDTRVHFDALKTALLPELPMSVDVYDYSTVPGTNGNSGKPPKSFVIVAVERRYNPNIRASAQAGSTGWRVSVRCVGSSVSNVALMLSTVALALNEQRIAIDTTYTTPIQFESDETPQFDSGKYSGLSMWTYAV